MLLCNDVPFFTVLVCECRSVCVLSCPFVSFFFFQHFLWMLKFYQRPKLIFAKNWICSKNHLIYTQRGRCREICNIGKRRRRNRQQIQMVQQTMFKWFTWGYVFLKATYKCIAGFWQMKLCCVYFQALDDDKQLFSTSSMPMVQRTLN